MTHTERQHSRTRQTFVMFNVFFFVPSCLKTSLGFKHYLCLKLTVTLNVGAYDMTNIALTLDVQS